MTEMIQLNIGRPLNPAIVRRHLVKQFAANYHHLGPANQRAALISSATHKKQVHQSQRPNLGHQGALFHSFTKSYSSAPSTTMASTDIATQPQQPKIKVYWLNESRAQRLLWLLEELHLDYDLEIFHRDKDMLAPPELKAIHPLGKAPILTITPTPSPDSPTTPKPLVLAESGFIMQYLSDHFGHAKPDLIPARYPPGKEGQLGAETESWMRYQYFLHYSEGSLQPALLVSIILEILKSNKIPFPIRPITSFVANRFFSGFVIPHMNTDLEFLEKQLETAPDGGGYLCGAHLTPADIILSFPLDLVRTRIGSVDGSILEKYPRLWAYLDRIKQEEGYKRADKRIEEVEGKGK